MINRNIIICIYISEVFCYRARQRKKLDNDQLSLLLSIKHTSRLGLFETAYFYMSLFDDFDEVLGETTKQVKKMISSRINE